MDFDMTAEQEMLKESAQEFFSRELNSEMIREMETDEKGYSPEIWEKISRIGWMGLLVPEVYDGAEMGLLDMSFQLCDASKDGSVDKAEMNDCAVPVSMDPKGEGILTVYSDGRFVIPSPGAPIPKPKNAPPGITQMTQFVSDSPYVEGGPSGADFIKLFDKDGDGKVGHMEWESVKNDTVFRPFRWPQYNKNRDQWITLEEAPHPPVE